MKINVFDLETHNKVVTINGVGYRVACIKSYGYRLNGAKKFHLRPINEILDSLSFVVWDNDTYYRIVNDNKSWKDKSTK